MRFALFTSSKKLIFFLTKSKNVELFFSLFSLYTFRGYKMVIIFGRTSVNVTSVTYFFS